MTLYTFHVTQERADVSFPGRWIWAGAHTVTVSAEDQDLARLQVERDLYKPSDRFRWTIQEDWGAVD